MAVSLNLGGAGASSRVVMTSGVAATTASYSISSGSNIALIVSIVTNGNTSITSCVWDAAGANQAMTLVSSQQENTFTRFAYIFALRNPGSVGAGSKSVTVTTNANDTIDVAAIAFNGVEQSSDVNAFKNAVGANGGGGPVSIAVTTVSGDATVADAISNGGSLAFTGTSPRTQWWNDTNLGGHYAAAGYALSTGTSDTFSWSQGFSDVWGAAGIHIVASGGAAPTAGLFESPLMNGLGAGGPFFVNPLGYPVG